jgi:hypothetical protein
MRLNESDSPLGRLKSTTVITSHDRLRHGPCRTKLKGTLICCRYQWYQSETACQVQLIQFFLLPVDVAVALRWSAWALSVFIVVSLYS